MTKQSIFLALAVGLLANLTFVTSSQAASTITVNSTLGDLSGLGLTPGDTINSVSVTFSGIPTPPGAGGVTVVAPAGASESVSGNTVTIDFSPVNPAATAAFLLINQAYSSFTFNVAGDGAGVTATSTVWSTTIVGGSGHANFSGTSSVSAASVPEPASMSLLGIGMAGLFAFRRYFRRNTNLSS